MWKNIIILNNNKNMGLIEDIQHIFSKEAVFGMVGKVPVVNPIVVNNKSDACYLMYESNEGIDLFYVNTNKMNAGEILTNLGIIIDCEYSILCYAGDELYCYDTYKNNSYIGLAYNINDFFSRRGDIVNIVSDSFGELLFKGVYGYNPKINMFLGKITALLKLTSRQNNIMREFLFSIFCLTYMKDMWTNILITQDGYSDEVKSIASNTYHNLMVIGNISENICNSVRNNYSIFDSDIACYKFIQDTKLEHNAILISVCNLLGLIYVSYYDKTKGWLFNIEKLNNCYGIINLLAKGVSNDLPQSVRNIQSSMLKAQGNLVSDKLNNICRKHNFSTIHFNTDIKQLLDANRGC